ncbi:MAG: aminomethyl-transferring glycine dehydrogenase subunit GcvPB [Candidatus Omnitrophota bacterium]|nr:aminomethyl-transferring glycine dehydrogenase subunit GcvPB [Candidatus Omnitrophota bacterium]MBU2034401.1 aminomethyl-transferring glycine dehydrogenase subunit GcvPB [Candidatus Omnitrophota bacterium]MBU2257545.1 aminomethyl-transferring glycine dehydrogenase subunit GcvPB [Candidatus Omnitrophota bacterium]
MQLIFEKSKPGRRAVKLPRLDVPIKTGLAAKYLRRKEADLPQASELDIVRHFTNLSRMNFSVDTNFYPLGSCTMKYNPKFTEKIARMEGFSDIHPLIWQLEAGEKFAQGALEVVYQLERLLSEITGMSAFTTQPLAGAHGELTGVMLIAAYHKAKGNRRKYVIVPDSSHGTNPASAAIAGYEVVVIPSDKNGFMDLEIFKSKLNPDVAAVMLTCPNTLGIFESQIGQICEAAHKVDALVYYDGANLNAILGKARPGDFGFDVVHLNLHKSFGTPHGGGGPGSGPVGVSKKLDEFLPVPRLIKDADGTIKPEFNRPKSIGRIAPFYGNFGVMLRAYAYILFLGKSGLIEVAEAAVLNANYCRVKLKEYFDLPYDRVCMHECVFSATRQKLNGVSALDIAKYLIEKRIHPPTIYFPLIVPEAIMIEPTETESKETLDNFIKVMKEAAAFAISDPQRLKDAPQNTQVSRLDEAKAVRDLDLRWHPL